MHEYEHLDAVLVAKKTDGPKGSVVSFAVRFRPAYCTRSVNFISGKKTIPYTIHPGLRQQYFHVSSLENNYLIDAQLSGGCRMPHIVEGFDGVPTVFRDSDNEAVRMPSHRLLKPGNYIVVTREQILDLLHPALAARTLEVMSGLHACQINIPEDPSADVRQNVKSVIHFQVTLKPADYGFLAPLGSYEIAPDCWETSTDEDLAVMIRLSKHLVPRPSQLLIQSRLSGKLFAKYLPIRDGSTEIVIESKASSQRPDFYRIGLTSPLRFLFQLSFSKEILHPRCAKVEFQFVTSSAKSKFTWSAHELPSSLLSALRGASSLISINMPKSVQICASDSRGKKVDISDQSPVDDLFSFLKNAYFPCVISSAGFPSIVLQQEQRPARRMIIAKSAPQTAFSTRQHARLHHAYIRGCISSYANRRTPQ
jgi:hypothetical protein